MKYIRLGLYILAALLVIPLGTNLVAAFTPHTYVMASWNNKPETMEQAKGLATDIVLAQVVKVEKGKDIVHEIQGEPKPEVIPTDLVTIKVTRSLKGIPAGSEVKVFHTGGASFSLEGDPAYKVGEQYVLFLQPQDGSANYLVISPEGRYAVRGTKLTAMSKKDFATAHNSVDVEAFLRTLEKGN